MLEPRFISLTPALVIAAGWRAAAVVGVVLFSSVAPDNFAAFDRAFLTLFYITGGDSWPDALPKFNEDGTANWVVAAYIMGYTMVELWVILQVDPPSCRQWPEVYELCHTFLNVVRVKKSTAMRESHAGMRIARDSRMAVVV